MGRLVVALLALALFVSPLPSGAQQPGKPACLGILYAASPAFLPETDPADRALVASLRDQGYVVGQNVVIEFRSLHGKGWDQIPILAAELVGLGVDAVVTTIEPYVTALRNASRTIPIVMAGASVDPVASGFVASLARPGGNVTGVTLGDLFGKRVELLREAVPGLRSVAASMRIPMSRSSPRGSVPPRRRPAGSDWHSTPSGSLWIPESGSRSSGP